MSIWVGFCKGCHWLDQVTASGEVTAVEKLAEAHRKHSNDIGYNHCVHPVIDTPHRVMNDPVESYQADLRDIQVRACEERKALIREAFEGGAHLALLVGSEPEAQRAQKEYATVLGIEKDDDRVKILSVINDIPEDHIGIHFDKLVP